MRWEGLCKPKSVGGLEFKKLHEFNLALLSKHGWKFLSDPMSLVSQIYRARYFLHSSFLNSKLGANPSYTRRSIHATKDLTRKHSRFRVGDSTNILVTKDPWLPMNGSGMISYRIFEICSFDIACHAVMICWTLWINRNNIVWKNHKWSLVQILTMTPQNPRVSLTTRQLAEFLWISSNPIPHCCVSFIGIHIFTKIG